MAARDDMISHMVRKRVEQLGRPPTPDEVLAIAEEMVRKMEAVTAHGPKTASEHMRQSVVTNDQNRHLLEVFNALTSAGVEPSIVNARIKQLSNSFAESNKVLLRGVQAGETMRMGPVDVSPTQVWEPTCVEDFDDGLHNKELTAGLEDLLRSSVYMARVLSAPLSSLTVRSDFEKAWDKRTGQFTDVLHDPALATQFGTLPGGTTLYINDVIVSDWLGLLIRTLQGMHMIAATWLTSRGGGLFPPPVKRPWPSTVKGSIAMHQHLDVHVMHHVWEGKNFWPYFARPVSHGVVRQHQMAREDHLRVIEWAIPHMSQHARNQAASAYVSLGVQLLKDNLVAAADRAPKWTLMGDLRFHRLNTKTRLGGAVALLGNHYSQQGTLLPPEFPAESTVTSNTALLEEYPVEFVELPPAPKPSDYEDF